MIGYGLNVYRGYGSQFGYGLGNVLGGIIRSAIPIVTPIAKRAGQELLLAGVKKIRRKMQQKKIQHQPPGKKVRRKKKSRKPRDIFK